MHPPLNVPSMCCVVLQPSKVTCDELVVSWKTAHDTEYRLEWPSRTDGWLGYVLSPPVHREGLAPDTAYSFRLRERRVGAELWSVPTGPQEFRTSHPMLQPVDAASISVETTCCSAQVSWARPEVLQERRVQEYKVRLRSTVGTLDGAAEETSDDASGDEENSSGGGGGGDNTVVVRCSGQGYVFNDLRSGATYTVSVSARNASRIWSAFCRDVPFRTGCSKPGLLLPADIEVAEEGFNGLALHWRRPPCNGSPVVAYELRYKESLSSDAPTVVPLPCHPAHTLTDLPADTAFEVSVRASNGEGFSDWSRPFHARTRAPTAFASDVHLDVATASSLRVRWTRVLVPRHTLLSYTLEAARAGFAYSALATQAAADGVVEYAHTHELLPPDTDVSYRLRFTTVRDGAPHTPPPGPVSVFRTLPDRPAQPQAPLWRLGMEGGRVVWGVPAPNGRPLTAYALMVKTAEGRRVAEVALPAEAEEREEVRGGTEDVGKRCWRWDGDATPEIGHRVSVHVCATNELGTSLWSKGLVLLGVGGGKLVEA